MRVRWVAMAATLLAGSAAAQQAWRTPGEEEANLARHLAAAGRCGEALDPFDRAVETRTGDASLRRDRGLCHERLGHPAPAIEDYRAYLSKAENAPDVGPIRARLDALEATQAASQRPVNRTSAATPTNTSPGAASGAAAEGRGDGRGFLLGFHLGDRAWSSSGYPVPTVSYGLVFGYSFVRALEVNANVVLLTTNVERTSGVGTSLGLTWKVGLDAGHRFEFALGAAGGFESQKNAEGTPRPLWLGRIDPSIRFLPLPALVLTLGPELGVGSIRRAPTSARDVPDSSVHTTFYGGNFEILWLLGGRGQSE